FQPIWSVSSRTLIAYEALARPPRAIAKEGTEELFKVAERCGLAFELDQLCQRTALRRAASLPPDVSLFLNLSPATLLHPRFSPKALAAKALVAGVPPTRVVIEITERAA